MFKDLNLKAVYSSDKDNIAEEFYIPVLGEAVRFDRVSAYFSAKALSLYAVGLERFSKLGNKYRLLISKDISSEDFDQIKRGYSLRTEIQKEMVDSIHDDKLTLEEERRLSNLAYFIAIGVIDVKIAFKTQGIFHDKTGLAIDRNGDIICFKGSNNETMAAVGGNNYETFQLMCSWLDCNNFYKTGIEEAQKEFEILWNNRKQDIVVLAIDDVLKEEILKFNKGEVIVETSLLEKEAAVLDFNGQLVLRVNTDNLDWLVNSAFYKMQIKSKVEKKDDNCIYFKTCLKYPDYKKIASILEKKIPTKGYKFIQTKRLLDYIDERDLHIKSRAKLGIELKTDAVRLDDRFTRFKEIVNNGMTRQLREKQMQDAFFMYAMTKSGNFSVPGSGKTSSALGVYTYLKQCNIIDRIVVIGPKNSFGSWMDEFKVCFEEKEQLICFNIQDSKFKSLKEKKYSLNYESGNCNLFLFNYESLGSIVQEVSDIVSKRTLLVFDEVHKVKRIKGIYAEQALEIADHALYTIAMTGTPIPNTYKDLYNLLHILYNDEYREFFDFSIPQLENPSSSDMQLINDKIQPFFCRTSKQELNVPPANEDDIWENGVEEYEQKLFEILCKKYQKNKLALVVRVLQMESNPQMLLSAVDSNEFSGFLDLTCDVDDIGYVDATKEVIECIDHIKITSKKKRCLELIDQLVFDNKKIIVWCIFRNTIETFKEELEKNNINAKCIYGEVDLDERLQIMDDFRQGKFDVLITNPHTLAESVSLHGICHDAIYFEYSYNLVHLLQSKDRIHRLGLEKQQYTQYYYMNQYYTGSHGYYSLDRQIYERLMEKEKTMLDAIDNHELEPVYTTDEDLELIFKNL